MKHEDLYTELSSIRNLMERSAKFISISGIAGVLAGCYALAGAGIAYHLIYGLNNQPAYRDRPLSDDLLIPTLALVAISVLSLSLGTGLFFSIRKARRVGQSIWNPASRAMLGTVAAPLATGGLLAIILVSRGYYEIVAPTFLLFYGLALVAGSTYSFKELRWLGFCEIILGLIAALLPRYGILFWTAGFGFLHIFYGSIMYFKYDR